MVLYFGIKRAKEEICRLNVEIRRKITSMVDEHVDFYWAITGNIIVNPALAVELQKRWLHAARISTSICKRLVSTSRLVGFSGSVFPGVREGRDPNRADGVPPPLWLSSVLGVAQIVVEYEDQEMDLEPEYNERDESDLVIRELDIDEDNLVELMEHLSTFDDS